MLRLLRFVLDVRRHPFLSGAVMASLVVAPPVVLWATVVAAQAPPAPTVTSEAPALTEVQQLHIRVALQAIEVAQLRAQLAQRDFEQARARLSQLVTEAGRPGYELDLTTLTFRPVVTEPDTKDRR